MELEMDCLTLRILLHKVCSYKCQFQRMSIFQSSMLVTSSHDGWAKCKEKVLDVSDPNQNAETRSHSKRKFTKLKDLFIKRVQKN